MINVSQMSTKGSDKNWLLVNVTVFQCEHATVRFSKKRDFWPKRKSDAGHSFFFPANARQPWWTRGASARASPISLLCLGSNLWRTWLPVNSKAAFLRCSAPPCYPLGWMTSSLLWCHKFFPQNYHPAIIRVASQPCLKLLSCLQQNFAKYLTRKWRLWSSWRYTQHWTILAKRWFEICLLFRFRATMRLYYFNEL